MAEHFLRVHPNPMRQPNNQEDIYGTTVVNDGTWHHIAVSYSTSDGEVRFYVDGGLDRSVGAHSGNAIGRGISVDLE